MIRKAEKTDIVAIADMYTDLLTYEQQHNNHSNWKLGVYPVITGTIYVLEESKKYVPVWS